MKAKSVVKYAVIFIVLFLAFSFVTRAGYLTPTFGSQSGQINSNPQIPIYDVYLDGQVRYNSVPVFGNGWSLQQLAATFKQSGTISKYEGVLFGLLFTDDVKVECILTTSTGESSPIREVKLGSFAGLGADTAKDFNCQFSKILSGNYNYKITVKEAGNVRADNTGLITVG